MNELAQETIIEDEGSPNPNETGEAQQSPEETHEELMGEPIEDADLISTAEFSVPEESAEESTDGKEEDGEKTLSTEELEKLDETFKNSPSFKGLTDQKEEAEKGQRLAETKLEGLQGQVETLTELVKGLGVKEEKGGKEIGYKDVLTLTDEEIIENFESDPKGFLSNFAQQVSAEIQTNLEAKDQERERLTSKQSQEKAINELYADYEKKNPDFVGLWESGEIEKFMNENPGNTPISAHKIIKTESVISNQDEVIKKAVDEAVALATKNFQTKQTSRVLSAGPGGGSHVTKKAPADLANTKNHGGLMRVLTQRSLARDKANG